MVKELLEERPLDRLRSVQGLLRLARRYSPTRLEAACARALHYGDASYRRLKRIWRRVWTRCLWSQGHFSLRCASMSTPGR